MKNLFNEIKHEEYYERKHADITKLGLNRSRNETIKAWMLGALKIKEKI